VAERVEPRPSDETPEVAWWPVHALPLKVAGGIEELVDRAVSVLRAG
jgi:hypothetical protein